MKTLSYFVLTIHRAITLSTVLALAGCAWATRNVYVDATGTDVGTIEFTNKSQDHLITIIVFEDSTDCRGTKFVSAFGEVSTKIVKANHRKDLAVSLGYTKLAPGTLSNCGVTYSLPFSAGHLRISSSVNAPAKKCEFLFESSPDGLNWVSVPNPQRRIPTQPMWQDGAFCLKSDS